MNFRETTRTIDAATELLVEGCSHQLAGRLREAAECFALAVDSAAADGTLATESEALRRLALVHQLQGETDAATMYARRSHEVAVGLNDLVLTAEATMAMAGIAFEHGRLADARRLYLEAVALACGQPDFAARVELSLGRLESIQGNSATALEHFKKALEGFRAIGNQRCEGMVEYNSATMLLQGGEPERASEVSQRAAQLARASGDRNLEGLCLVGQAELDLAEDRPEAARRKAEGALVIFQRLGARVNLADASRVLGSAFRMLGRPTLAESRLSSAIEIACAARAQLVEAQACRDLALLREETGQSVTARVLLEQALRLFEKLGAVPDITDIKVRLTQFDRPGRERRRLARGLVRTS